MTDFGTRDEAVAAFERHVQFMLEARDEDLLFRLPRFIRFMATQPLLSSVCDELSREANTFRNVACAQTTLALDQLRPLVAEVARLLNEVECGPLNDLAAQLSVVLDSVSLEKPALNDWTVSHDDPHGLGPALQELHILLWSADSLDEVRKKSSLQEALAAARMRVLPFKTGRATLLRERLVELRSGGAFALERLKALASAVVPNLNQSDGSDAFLRLWFQDEGVAEALYGASLLDVAGPPVPMPSFMSTPPPAGNRVEKLGSLSAEARRDIKLIALDLRLRIDELHSLRTLVARFVARATLFDGNRLRSIATTAPGHLERVLTTEFATYLFDRGLNPLVDPTVAELRPDLLGTGLPWTMYVEAKQYDHSLTKRAFIKFAAQVWSTWGRLRANWDVREAFLLVFRRGGPLFRLPDVVRHGTLTLHPFLVDIAPPAVTGSRATALPIEIHADDLRPKSDGPY
jgi:hypothetical protein